MEYITMISQSSMTATMPQRHPLKRLLHSSIIGLKIKKVIKLIYMEYITMISQSSMTATMPQRHPLKRLLHSSIISIVTLWANYIEVQIDK